MNRKKMILLIICSVILAIVMGIALAEFAIDIAGVPKRW